LAYLAGIVVSLVSLRRHRAVAFLTLLVATLLLARLIASDIVFTILPLRLFENGWSFGRADNLLPGLAIFNSFLGAGLWVLLLIAVFGWRRQRPSARARDFSPADTFPANNPQAEASQAIQQKKQVP